MAGEATMSGRETATYIESMLLELRAMSDNRKFEVLTYLLEMALIEATDLSHGIHLKQQELEEEVPDPAAKWYSA